MIGRQFPDGSVDEVAVRRDDELLGLLARRTAPREPDAAVSLLWALTLDVDREDPALARDPGPDDVLGARRATTRHGARGTVVGVVVAAMLSVSGVAAAVTGDPLSPYRAVISLAQDDDPPPRRGVAPAVARREGTTTGPTGGVVAAPDLVGRVAVAGAPETKAAGKAARAARSPGRAGGTTGRPVSPGRSADRASGTDAPRAAEAARAAKAAEARKTARLAEVDREASKPAKGEKATQPQRGRAARPETKEQREKP